MGTIDGVSKGTYNLYQLTQKWQVVIPFTGSSAGQHTLEIRPLGTKAVVVDAFRGRLTPVGSRAQCGEGAEGGQPLVLCDAAAGFDRTVDSATKRVMEK